MTGKGWARPSSPLLHLRSGPSESGSSAESQVLTPSPVSWLEPEWLSESSADSRGLPSAESSILASAQVQPQGFCENMSSESSRRAAYSPRQRHHVTHSNAYMRHPTGAGHCEPSDSSIGHNLQHDGPRRSRAYTFENPLPGFEYQMEPTQSHDEELLVQDQIQGHAQYNPDGYHIRLPSTESQDPQIQSNFDHHLSNTFGPLLDHRVSPSHLVSSQSLAFSSSCPGNPPPYSTSLERRNHCYLPQSSPSHDMVRSKSPHAYTTTSLPVPPLALPGRVEYVSNVGRDSARSITVASLTSSPSCYNAAVDSDYGVHTNNAEQQARLHFPNLERLKSIHTEQLADGSGSRHVKTELVASVDKNIFVNREDQNVTCYRRNYISVQCHYELTDYVANGSLFLSDHETGGARMIQAFGVSLSATIDDPHGKTVDLVQHTAKRDKGPKGPPSMVVLGPSAKSHTRQVMAQQPMPATNGPNLPLQNSESSRMPYANNQHTFERIQFSQATANNGRKRAQQQYYYLIVQLNADVRQPGESTPDWKLVARLISDPIVVRGRSPGHYKDQQGDGPGAASGGGHGHLHLYGSHAYLGASRSSSMSGTPFLGGHGPMQSGSGCFRGQPYVQASPTMSQAGSVASSCHSDAKYHRSAPPLKCEGSEYGFRAPNDATHIFNDSYGLHAAKNEAQTLPSMYAPSPTSTKLDEPGTGHTSHNNGWQTRFCGGFESISNAGWAINAGY